MNQRSQTRKDTTTTTAFLLVINIVLNLLDDKSSFFLFLKSFNLLDVAAMLFIHHLDLLCQPFNLFFVLPLHLFNLLFSLFDLLLCLFFCLKIEFSKLLNLILVHLVLQSFQFFLMLFLHTCNVFSLLLSDLFKLFPRVEFLHTLSASFTRTINTSHIL